MNIGLRIRELRKQKKFTQQDLADKMQVSKQVVSSYENGSAFPTAERMAQMLRIFKISKEDFDLGIASGGDNLKERIKQLEEQNFQLTQQIIELSKKLSK